MTQLETFRNEIDAIDEQIQNLFLKRMELVRGIAEFKMERDLTVYDHRREEEVLHRNFDRIKDSPYAEYYRRVLECILGESKAFQKNIIIGRTL